MLIKTIAISAINCVYRYAPTFRKALEMTTSKKDASKASKLLRTSPNKTVRSVAASDLAQAKHKKPTKPSPKK